MSLAVLYREELKEYDFGAGHSFRGERYHTFYHFFKEHLTDENYQIISAEKATDDDLLSNIICFSFIFSHFHEFFYALVYIILHPSYYIKIINKTGATFGTTVNTAKIISLLLFLFLI